VAEALPGDPVQLAVAASGQPKKPSRATVALAWRNESIAAQVMLKVSVSWCTTVGLGVATWLPVWPVLGAQPGGRAVGVALGEVPDHPVAAAARQRQRERRVGSRGEAPGEADPASPVLPDPGGELGGDRARAGQEVVDRER
jgi:hypothetical protein